MAAAFRTSDPSLERQTIMFNGSDGDLNGYGAYVNDEQADETFPSDGSVHGLYGGVNWWRSNTAVGADNFHVVTWTIPEDNPSEPVLRLDGQEISTTSQFGDPSGPETPTTQFGIGYDDGAIDERPPYFAGDIGEVRVYNRELADHELEQLESDLGEKWGASVPEPDLPDGMAIVPQTGGGTASEPAFSLAPEGDTFNDLSGGGTTSGADDLSADVYLGYDADNLYLTVEVTDDTHTAMSGADMWQADSLQWAVASDGTYGPEYGLSRVDGGTSKHKWISANEGAGTDAVDATTSRDGTTTTYEATIPWNANFAESKGPGDSFPFSVLINESDGDGRAAVLGWTLPGISDDKSPGGLGTLVLGESDGTSQ